MCGHVPFGKTKAHQHAYTRTNAHTCRANTMKVKHQHNHIIYLISSLCQIHRIKGIWVHKQNFKWIKGFAKQNKTKKERKGMKCHIVWVRSAYRKTFHSDNEMYFYVSDMCSIAHITSDITHALQLTFDLIKTAGMWPILFAPIWRVYRIERTHPLHVYMKCGVGHLYKKNSPSQIRQMMGSFHFQCYHICV